MINFYRLAISHAAQMQAPLHALTAGVKKRDKRPIEWSDLTSDAFTKCKE